MDFVDGLEVLDAITEQPEGFYSEETTKIIFK
jgi:hypothetical protein